MNIKETWRGLLVMLVIGLVAGVLNTLLFVYVMNPLLESAKEDEVAVSTYAINLFVGWVFFSAWFLARADDEVKKVEEAVHKHDKHTFLVEAPKQIALSIRILYLLISVLVILSFHLFFLHSQIVTAEIQFGIGFLVVTTALVLWDLDNPLSGAISVANIPEEWLRELEEQEQAARHPVATKPVEEKVEA
jgi:Na+/melibiose symporter-like transporter